MNFSEMSIEGLRALSGKIDVIANFAGDLEFLLGQPIRIDLTGPALMSFPLFPAENQNTIKKANPAPEVHAAVHGTLPDFLKADKPQKPEPKPHGVRGDMWTKDEDERAIAMVQAGKSAHQIADALGRPFSGTQYRLRNKLKHAYAGKVAASPKPAPQAMVENPAPVAVVAHVAVTPPPPPIDTVQPDQPAWARAIHAGLNALGYAGFWTAQLDHEFIEGLGRGKFADVRAELEIDRKDALDRWDKLQATAKNPDGGFTTECQARLTTVLRDRAASQRQQANKA
jgi:hypothetical protein